MDKPTYSASASSRASSSPSSNNFLVLDEKMTKLLNEKKSARNYQVRRHEEWDENYELYRGKIQTNRLTQRQAVNIPLMKETIKTLLSKVDDAPDTEWKEKSGDEMKEIVYQTKWDDDFRRNKLDWKDILDKKNVFLYGLSTKMLNPREDHIEISVLDVYDIVFDPLMRPLDIESARFIVRQNIFRTLREILVDDRYTQSGKDKLKHWLAMDKGIVQSGKNKQEWEKSMERLRAMGVQHDNFPLFAGGDVIVSLTEHYTHLWDKKEKKFKRHVVVYADDTIELSDDLLTEYIGVDVWPFVVWSEDPETNDIYPDSVADLVRTPNKILNIWYSQFLENRTLQNFQMHWYDATHQGYKPQTYEPSQGRMLPAPGDPHKTIMPVELQGLGDTMTAIDFVTRIVERGTGATAIEKAQIDKAAKTLGEVEIAVGKAQERAKTMAKFYQGSWLELAKKWDMMMQANDFEAVTLYKTGSNGKLYSKVITSKDWKSKAGYEATVASSSEQESDMMDNIQKFAMVRAQFPNNGALARILQKRELKLLDLTPAELKEVQEEEEKLANMVTMPENPGAPAPANQTVNQGGGTAPPSPAGEDVNAELEKLGQLLTNSSFVYDDIGPELQKLQQLMGA